MIKNIIFDYGKVLVNWNPYFQYTPFFADEQKYKYFLEEILTDEWYNEGDIGVPMEELIEKWSARYPEFADAFQFYVDGFEDSISGEVPGMYELISGLKQRGYRTWGLSNWSWEMFQRILPKYRIFSLMEGMVISGKVHMLKPNPEIYEYFLERYSLKAEECVFIDDRPENIVGAALVGIKGIVFKDTEQLSAELEPLLSGKSQR
jgi:HAD superfamily hydrolase (TIGR01509 family)